MRRSRITGALGKIDPKAIAYWRNGYSVLFPGVDEYIDCGNGTANFEYTQAFSTAYWFKTSSVANSLPLSKLSSVLTRGWQNNLDTAGRLLFGLYHVGGGTNALAMRTVNGFNNGVWRHAVATYDGSNTPAGIKIYINAVSETLTTTQNNLDDTIVNDAICSIGSFNGASYFYNGNMDEILIYNKKLSSAEVTALYNGGVPIDPAGLSTWSDALHYWRMGDKDIFNILKDNKGSADGTMTNMLAGDIVQDTP